MGLGFKVCTSIDRSCSDLAKQFMNYPTGVIADCMSRFGAMNGDIKQMSRRGIKLGGVAVTVSTRVGDNLMLHKAIDIAQEGDIIVISNEMGRNRSLLGDIIIKMCINKGVSGIVVDGPIRDIEEIYKLNFPIYATGTNPNGPYKDGPGEVNYSISCGGVRVNPGDIICGDDDGVLVIPFREAKELLLKVVDYAKKDAKKAADAEKGLSDRSWVDVTLQNKGCEIN